MPFLEQLYQPHEKILKRVKVLRFFVKIIRGILGIKKNNFFNNVLQQNLISYETISIDQFSMNLIGGSEKLHLANNTQYFIEKDLTKWILEMNTKDIFYDIGANVGMFSCLAAKRSIKTYSFECMNSNLNSLSGNIMLNKVEKNIIVVPLMLSDQDGIEILQHRDLMPGTAKNEIADKENRFSNEIKSVLNLKTTTFRVDTIIKVLKMSKPTKIKLDVDGAELKILEGFGEYINDVTEIMIELFDYKQLLYNCYFDNEKNKIKKFKDEHDHYHEIINEPRHREYDAIVEYLLSKKFYSYSQFGNNVLFKKKLT